ncbi:HEAT repeat domain-containing protein [Capnocytophaga sp. oral taxon 878]|uniref:HEAT repeat domain-containing protein n=1 Tax=Capnocytophaga sp. oral taxon 878 TaxID=1316596 RepID=UPI000D02531B|nr:HEAT repeat domain-containing protein [Capnocytophaga sp. oral taxon 878]AVM49395.1 hypothetical protein C4H12_02325 [Capnocytophaga sp. oral taxon 878]
MKPLYDLQQELNRLFIAGSKFAKNDPRLQKHVPILKKLGEKAPVFNKLAQEVESLLQVESTQAAEKLLNVATLLYSVLYTQGVTVEAEAEKSDQVPTIALADVNTTYSYLQLKPVLQALTESKSGRLEVLKDAFERKLFDDSRTYGYLSYALADKYTELADYVEETIIPPCGKAMLPFLLSDFHFEDKTEHVRRLRLLHQLGYEGIDALVDKIFAENLPNLQAEAVIILSDKKDEKTEDFIISLASDKNKVVRGAAYKALAKLGTQRSIDKLYELYSNNKQKGNAELLANAIATVPLASCYRPFVQKVHERFKAVLSMDETDEKTLVAAFEQLPIEISTLQNKDYSETYTILGEILRNKTFNAMAKKRSVSNYYIAPQIRSVLATFNTEKVIAFYDEYNTEVLGNTWTYSLSLDFYYRVLEGQGNFSKEKIYDIFAPQFGKVFTPQDIMQPLSGKTRIIYDSSGYANREIKPITKEQLDPRWADLFYNYFAGLKKYDSHYDLDALAILNILEENSERLKELTLKVLPKVYHYGKEFMYRFIMKSNIVNKFEVLFEDMSKIKNQVYIYHTLVNDTDYWKLFPKEYALKFRELHEKTKSDFFKEIAWQIEQTH